MAIWDAYLTERDKAVFGSAGYGKLAGFGRRPVVLVVDVNYNFVGDRPEPILEIDQALAEQLRRRGLGGRGPDRGLTRGRKAPAHPRHLQHGNRGSPRQLGVGAVAR